MTALAQPQRIGFERWWSKELTQCKHAITLSQELQTEMYALLQLVECPYGEKCNHRERSTGCYHKHDSGEEFPKNPAEMPEKIRAAYMELCGKIVALHPEAMSHLAQYAKAKDAAN